MPAVSARDTEAGARACPTTGAAGAKRGRGEVDAGVDRVGDAARLWERKSAADLKLGLGASNDSAATGAADCSLDGRGAVSRFANRDDVEVMKPRISAMKEVRSAEAGGAEEHEAGRGHAA